jgi:phosphotransferase system enzyme I (PtsP)
VDTLSISASSIPRIKWLVRTVESSRARWLMEKALAMEDPEAIRAMLVAELERFGLGGLIRAGR